MTIISSILFLFLLAIWFVPPFEQKCSAIFTSINHFLNKKEKLLLISALLLYTLITILLQANRSMDGDEAQAWLIARDSPSLRKMYSLFGYEGSPGLWHTLLRPFAIAGVSFNWIYVLNHLFITLAIIIWLWKSPFPLLIRLLLPFSHVLLTEYSINARSYALSLFLLFAALYIYTNRNKYWWLWSLLFFLLANTNIHSTFLCCGFCLFLILSYCKDKSFITLKALTIVSIGIMLAVIQVIPPSDLDPKISTIGLQSSLSGITGTILPLKSRIEVWIYAALVLQIVISIRRKEVRVMLIATHLALFAFLLFRYPGELRHHFFLYTSLLFSIWLGGIRNHQATRTWLFLILTLLIMIQFSIRVTIFHLKPNNNYKKELRDYIKNEIHPDRFTFIAAFPGNVAVSYLPYFPKDQPYYLFDEKRWGSYTIWSEKKGKGEAISPGTHTIKNLVTQHPGFKRYYYMSVDSIPSDSLALYDIRLLKKSKNKRSANLSPRWSRIYFYQLHQE